MAADPVTTTSIPINNDDVERFSDPEEEENAADEKQFRSPQAVDVLRKRVDMEDSNASNSSTPTKGISRNNTTQSLVSYGRDEDRSSDDDDEENSDDNDKNDEMDLSNGENNDSSPSSSDAKVVISVSDPVIDDEEDDDWEDDGVSIPPPTKRKCSPKLLAKMQAYWRKFESDRNLNLNEYIQRDVQFRNPSLYDKFVERYTIDEKGTQFPLDAFGCHPSVWESDSYYDELAKAQKIEMDRREKEKKKRTEVEFVNAKKPTADSKSTVPAKK